MAGIAAGSVGVGMLADAIGNDTPITLGGALASLVLVLDQGLSWGWLSVNSLLTYTATIVFAIIFYFMLFSNVPLKAKFLNYSNVQLLKSNDYLEYL